MNKVYLLYHSFNDGLEYESESGCEIIGIFTTKEKAKQAMNERFEEFEDHEYFSNLVREEDEISFYDEKYYATISLFISEQSLDTLF